MRTLYIVSINSNLLLHSSTYTDILVVGSNNKVLPQDGYILMEATTSLTCYTNPDCYEADSVEWLDQNGNRITISKREDVYQELSDFKSIIYFNSKNLSLEGFYLCRGRIAEGVVKQIKVGVFDTPPGTWFQQG